MALKFLLPLALLVSSTAFAADGRFTCKALVTDPIASTPHYPVGKAISKSVEIENDGDGTTSVFSLEIKTDGDAIAFSGAIDFCDGPRIEYQSQYGELYVWKASDRNQKVVKSTLEIAKKGRIKDGEVPKKEMIYEVECTIERIGDFRSENIMCGGGQ